MAQLIFQYGHNFRANISPLHFKMLSASGGLHFAAL